MVRDASPKRRRWTLRRSVAKRGNEEENGPMGFPWLLLGGLAAGIPVALHFFFRSRYRVVPWAAMAFLLTSVQMTSRRLKFQELLLLLLRVDLLLLLAFALAQPL